jgi:tetratricopeptide (TPR) repeat protein
MRPYILFLILFFLVNSLYAQNNSCLEYSQNFSTALNNGDFEDALAIAKKHLSEAKKAKVDSAQSAALHNLGVLYETIGEYDKAETSYLSSLELAAASKAGKSKAYGQTLISLGVLYSNGGRFEEAEDNRSSCAFDVY